MTDITQQDIIEAVETALDKRDSIDKETHSVHHRFVARRIEREEKRDAMWEKIRAQVTGWSIIVILGSVGTAVTAYFLGDK